MSYALQSMKRFMKINSQFVLTSAMKETNGKPKEYYLWKSLRKMELNMLNAKAII